MELMAHDKEWFDMIDLTPGLVLTARRVEHSDAGPLLEIVSRCKSGPMASRCAPRGWAKGSDGSSRPVLPEGWTQAKLEKLLAHELPSLVDDRVLKLSENAGLALLFIAASTQDQRDKDHAKDDIRAFKRAGLAEFEPWDRVWAAIPEPIEMKERPPEGSCRALVPLDRLDHWIDAIGALSRKHAKLGRGFSIQASLDGMELSDWKDLKQAGARCMLREIGSIDLAKGESLWGRDPCSDGGVSMALEPGRYRAFLSREHGVNCALSLISDQADPALVADESAWGMFSADIDVDSGMAGFFKADSGVDHSSKKYDAVCKATDASVAAGLWPWGVASSAGHGDGSYPCQALKGQDGRPIGARIVFFTPEPKSILELSKAASALSASEVAAELEEAAALAAPKGRRGPRV